MATTRDDGSQVDGVGPADTGGAYRSLAGRRARLDRRGRGEHVAELVREAVLAGDFAPGERLGEPEICTALGVSRNTLREAFRILVEERVAEHRLHRGVFVRIPTPAEVSDLYTCRRVIECAAVRAWRPGDLGLDAVRTAVARARDRAAAGGWTRRCRRWSRSGWPPRGRRTTRPAT